MKYLLVLSADFIPHSRSRKGAWIEIEIHPPLDCVLRSRSRKGAWIEISISLIISNTINVAPVRERGLKFDVTVPTDTIRHCRSRKGAWIEIARALPNMVGL